MAKELNVYRPNSVWDFMSEVERVFDDAWKSPEITPRGRLPDRTAQTFHPAVDVHETPDFYMVSVDLPGIEQKDVKIDVQNGRLTVSGERSKVEHSKEGMFKRIERSYGRFERAFQLPQEVDENKIKAAFQNGVLEVLIPKVEVAKARTIPIESEKGGLFSRLLGNKTEGQKTDA